MRAYRIRRYGDKRRHENWKIEDRGKKRRDETSQAEIGWHRREDRRLDEKRKRQETQNGTEMTIRRERGQNWSEMRQVELRDKIKCKREETRRGDKGIKWDETRQKTTWEDRDEMRQEKRRWEEQGCDIATEVPLCIQHSVWVIKLCTPLKLCACL